MENQFEFTLKEEKEPFAKTLTIYFRPDGVNTFYSSNPMEQQQRSFQLDQYQLFQLLAIGSQLASSQADLSHAFNQRKVTCLDQCDYHFRYAAANEQFQCDAANLEMLLDNVSQIQDEQSRQLVENFKDFLDRVRSFTGMNLLMQ